MIEDMLIDTSQVCIVKRDIKTYLVQCNDIINKDGCTVLSQRGKSEPHKKGQKPTTVFRFNTGSALRGINHPAPYHPELPEFFIKWLTDVDDIVFDPFIGSGTTAISAYKMNRKFIGFESNEKYIVDTTVPRLEELGCQKPYQ